MRYKTLIILLLVIAFGLLCVMPIRAESFKFTIKGDEDPEMVRRSLARELLKLGFNLTYNKRHTLFETNQFNNEYLYQVYIHHTKHKIVVTAFVFLEGNAKWSWRIADKQALDELIQILQFCYRRAKGEQISNDYIINLIS